MNDILTTYPPRILKISKSLTADREKLYAEKIRSETARHKTQELSTDDASAREMFSSLVAVLEISQQLSRKKNNTSI